MSITRFAAPLVGVYRGFFHGQFLLPWTLVLTLLGVSGLAQDRGKKKVPPPVPLRGNEMVTKDGVQLSATFYPGTEGKDSIPVILLHMWKGDRKEYADLALRLQQEGYAVLVPDLRGHGESTQAYGGTLDGAKMPPDHFYQMPYSDMETLRKFLVRKNDAGELNLSKTVIVGAEMGAAVAVYYAAYDWSTPRRESGAAAIPQDVKALVLISPKWDFKGLPLNKQLNHPAVRSLVSILIAVGKNDSRSLADANRVNNLLERFRLNPDDIPRDQRNLFFGQLPTSLQGTKMLGVEELKLEDAISQFISFRVGNKEFPWRQRSSKAE